MKKSKNPTIYEIVEDYLSKKYDLRYNSISLALEITLKNKNDWNECNENTLWLELQKQRIKIPINHLLAILKSDFVKKFNPIIDYFNNLPKWNGKIDYIKKFSEYIILDEDEDKNQFEYHFKKWCVRVVKCAIENDYFNKQAFILTDDGLGQNIGKTSWCRFLCPEKLSDYIAQDIPDQEKDARLLFAKNFLVNLDELASLSRKEINKLKSYFTLNKINERLPYDRKNSILTRISSFIGSTNMSTFLHDETGSVRWLCFIIKSINWSYKNEFEIDNLWSQAYTLLKHTNFNYDFSNEDMKLNEIRNQKFQISSTEKELIMKYFEVPTDLINSEFLTASDIIQIINTKTIGVRLNNVAVGKALKSIGFTRAKHKGQYGYWVTIK